MKTLEIVKKNSYRRNTLIKTKFLTKFQVYILSGSHFTAVSRICHLYSVLTVKSSFCEHHPSKSVHSFKSCNDAAMKFDKNASNMLVRKVNKICHQKHFHSKDITDFILGGV